MLEKDGPGRAGTAKTHADFELCSEIHNVDTHFKLHFLSYSCICDLT